MSKYIAQMTVATWSIIASAIITESLKKIMITFTDHVTKDDIRRTMTVSTVASLFINTVGAVAGGSTITQFAVGVATGSIVLGVTAMMVQFLVSVNWQSMRQAASTVTTQFTYWGVKLSMWWRARRPDTKRRKAEETVRKAS
jgi:uncharacterized membrane protein YoaK (UPF0700 family)